MQLNDTGVLFTFFPYDTRDPYIQKYLTSIGSNGVYYTRRRSNVELALDLPSLKVKDSAFGTALHEFSESYFPSISRTASPKAFCEYCNGQCGSGWLLASASVVAGAGRARRFHN